MERLTYRPISLDDLDPYASVNQSGSALLASVQFAVADVRIVGEALLAELGQYVSGTVVNLNVHASQNAVSSTAVRTRYGTTTQKYWT